MSATASSKGQQRGPVLAMMRQLLDSGQDEEVLALVRQLLARNEELERRLGGRMKANEGVSSAQLRMLLDEVQAGADAARQQADEKLRAQSGIDGAGAEGLETEEPPRRNALARSAARTGRASATT